MLWPKKWMTTEEIRAFAYLLDTPIYSYVEFTMNGKKSFAWERIPHPAFTPNVTNDRGIYILNSAKHFQLITIP